MIAASQMQTASAVAFVLARDGERALADIVREMGGGWAQGMAAMDALRMPYVVLVAPTRARIEARAPLAIVVRDLDALARAVAHVCSLLDDVRCLWVNGTTGAAHETVQRTVMADAKAEGSA